MILIGNIHNAFFRSEVKQSELWPSLKGIFQLLSFLFILALDVSI